MTTSTDIAQAYGARRRLALRIDGLEPVLWQPVGVGVDDLHVFDPPGRAPISGDCVALWRMDGAAGANEPDATGHGHTATDNGTIGTFASLLNSCRGVFATTKYFEVADSTALRLQTFTLSLWVYQSADSQAGYAKIIVKDHSDVNNSWALHNSVWPGPGSARWQFYYYDTNGDGHGVADTQARAVGWHHMCAVVSGGVIWFYIDAELIGTDNSGAGQTIRYDSDSLFIGRDGDPAYNTQFLNGCVDDIAIYNTAKPPGWIKQAYATGAPGTRSGLNCLIPPQELSIGLNIQDAKPEWAGITFELIDIPDPDDPSTSYFGKLFAAARWDDQDAGPWRLEWATVPNTVIEADAASLTFEDVTDMPSSGTLYFGSETITYTSLAVKTISGVTKGKYSATGGTWGRTYSSPLEEGGGAPPPLQAGLVPFSMHGRRVALYEVTFDEDNGCWHLLSAESPVWVGRITTGIKYSPRKQRGIPGVWQVACEAITAQLESKIANKLPQARLYGINLTGTLGRDLLVQQYTDGALDAEVTVTIPAGFYETLKELAAAANQAFLDQVVNGLTVNPFVTDAGFMSQLTPTLGKIDTEGPYDIMFANMAVNQRVIFKHAINHPTCHAFNALGFYQLFTGTYVVYGEDSAIEVISGEQPYPIYHPLDRRVNNERLYIHPDDIDELWSDQGDDDSAAACVVVEKANLGTIAAFEQGYYIARYDTITASTYLDLMEDPLMMSEDGYISSAANAEEWPIAKQCYVPTYRTKAGVKRGPFEALLYPLLSTGTEDYNSATYDKLPLPLSVCVQLSLVNTASFLAADQAIAGDPSAQRWDPQMGCYFISEPISYMELLRRECQLYGYAVCWKRGQLALVATMLPPVDAIVTTLDDNNSSNIHDRPDSDASTGTVVNRYECSVLRNHYTGKAGRVIEIVDNDSIEGLGHFTSMSKIEHPGLPSPSGAGLPDAETMGVLLAGLLRGRSLRFPSQVIKRSINATMERKVYIGEVVRLQSDTIPDPLGSGSMTVNIPSQVLNRTWNYGKVEGSVTLRLLSEYANYGKPWAPAALVDITAANGGWAVGTFTLTLVAKEFTPSTFTNHDGQRFAAGDIVRVLERNAYTGGSEAPGCTVVSYTPGTRALVLADDAATAALDGMWDGDVEWVVLFDDHDNVVDDQKEEAFQGSTSTYHIGTTNPDRWG